jgi:hypothetical protein
MKILLEKVMSGWALWLLLGSTAGALLFWQ